VRISVTSTGIWLVNYLVHKHGYQNFELDGCAEQGRNSLWLGALSMGEGWHNNHHAYPRSARLGFHSWELDPGYWWICFMRWSGLAWEVQTFEDFEARPNLHPRCPWCGGSMVHPSLR
jgi:stearoyl-CoA desaturase (delta-9 desaturase)